MWGKKGSDLSADDLCKWFCVVQSGAYLQVLSATSKKTSNASSTKTGTWGSAHFSYKLIFPSIFMAFSGGNFLPENANKWASMLGARLYWQCWGFTAACVRHVHVFGAQDSTGTVRHCAAAHISYANTHTYSSLLLSLWKGGSWNHVKEIFVKCVNENVVQVNFKDLTIVSKKCLVRVVQGPFIFSLYS